MKDLLEMLDTYGWPLVVAGVALFLLRFLIGEWVKRMVHSTFDEDLARAKEVFRSETEGALERLRAENRARENLQAAAMSNFAASHRAAQDRRLEAIGVAWTAITRVRDCIPWYIWTVDLCGYKEKLFGSRLIPLLRKADYGSILQPTLEIDKAVVLQRPFLGDHLYGLYRTYGAFLGRAVTETLISYRDGALKLWMNEGDTALLIRETLDEREFEEFQALKSEQLTWLCNNLEEKFIASAGPAIFGDASASEAVVLAEKVFDKVEAVVRRRITDNEDPD